MEVLQKLSLHDGFADALWTRDARGRTPMQLADSLLEAADKSQERLVAECEAVVEELSKLYALNVKFDF